jgi:hypothetical protein
MPVWEVGGGIAVISRTMPMLEANSGPGYVAIATCAVAMRYLLLSCKRWSISSSGSAPHQARRCQKRRVKGPCYSKLLT